MQLEGLQGPVKFLGRLVNELKAYMVTELKWPDCEDNPNELHVDHSTEFYRLWSAILFAFVLASAKPQEKASR